ncbi:hypothetical protein ABZ815_43590 [Nonomuraea sp. NPDC047529]|uniref:hypothetical protein n=1 Tax=Nonomuraea sp. NPDC047529 TaxID=3155623 RepID=UPI0033E98B1D
MRTMVLLGLLLMVAGSAAVVVLFTQTTTTAAAALTLMGVTFRVGDLELFSAGAATATAFILGAFLIVAGTSRKLARRRELRRLLAERTDDRPATAQPDLTADRHDNRTTDPASDRLVATDRTGPTDRTDRTDGRDASVPGARHRTPADRLVAGRRRPVTG